MMYEVVFIPIWYFLVEASIFLSAAVIGLLTAYYAHKAYVISGNKKQLLQFYLGFLLLGLGVLAHGILSYLGFALNNELLLFTGGYLLYAALTLSAYALLLQAYIKNKLSKLAYLAVPLLLLNVYPYFHLISILFLMVIIAKVYESTILKKNKLSKLVTITFMSFILFHVLSLQSSCEDGFLYYVLANISLSIGFALILLVLNKVTRH